MFGMSYRESCTPVICVPAGEWLPCMRFWDIFGMQMWYRILDCFYAFQIPPHVCPDKMDANKNTVQAVSYTVSLEDGTENTPRRNKQTCQKGGKKGILISAVRSNPLCRWANHLRRYRGAPTPLYCRYFVSACIILPNKCSVNYNVKKNPSILVKIEKSHNFLTNKMKSGIDSSAWKW